MASVRELQGPLLPSKALVPENDDCLEEEEEEEEPVFVDAEELCSGGLKAGSLPGCLRGEEAREPGGGVGGGGTAFWCDPVLGKAPSAVHRLPVGRPGSFVLVRVKLYW